MVSIDVENLKSDGIERIDSRYRVEEEINRGSTASVFRAVDLEADRPVAVKLFHPRYHSEPRFAIRFRAHLRRLAGLRHENLVPVLDYGIHGDRYFIIMEWVEGINLGSYLDEHGRTSVSLTLFIAHQVCAALQEIHRHELIHQGVKPRNILLTAEGQVKLTDVGLSALLSESGLSRTHVMLAGAGYIAPEQARGRRLTKQSDIYSLGATLFEMLAGRLPFESKDVWSMVRMHAGEAPPSPRQFNRQVPEDLANLVVRALQKDPQFRYSSAAEMDAALSVLENEYVAESMETGKPDHRPAAVDFISFLKDLFEPGMAKALLLEPWPIVGRSFPFGAVLAVLTVLAFLIAFTLLYVSLALF